MADVVGNGVEALVGARGGSAPAAAVGRVRLSREQNERRRRELGDFIRSRRERTAPEAVGLPPGPRRRTPGLRREEVALLAGIGVTWYTWLEQGRQINVSSQVLLSVVRVLGLDDVERAHVFHLADVPDPEHMVAEGQVSPAVQLVLDQLNPYPASVIGSRWTILAGNQAYRALVGDFRDLPPCARNTLWMFFTDPEWRTLAADWAGTSRQLVAKLRAAVAADPGDPGWGPMLDALNKASPEFRELWRRQEVAGMDSAVKCFYHSVIGPLDFAVTHMLTADGRGTRMSVYTPRTDETRDRLARLMTVTPRRLTYDEDHFVHEVGADAPIGVPA